jgi:hypothetical protein
MTWIEKFVKFVKTAMRQSEEWTASLDRKLNAVADS